MASQWQILNYYRTESLFDHLVGAGEQRGGYGEAECLGCFEVDDQLVFSRRLHRKIARFLALEDAIDVAGGLSVLVDEIGPVRNKSAVGDEVTVGIDRGQSVTGCKRYDYLAMNRCSATRHD